jgi:hypothetical protein
MLVPADQAIEPIKHMLLGNGGSASVRIGNSTRTLSRDPVSDRPLTPLPCPLNLLQPHSFRYRVYEGNIKVEEPDFKRGQINSAMSRLLAGVPLDEEILLMPHERW